MGTKKERWAARCWHWRSEADKQDECGDLAYQQVEQWRDAPNKGLAHHEGKRLAAHPMATSPGLYDVMRGTPSTEIPGEWDWEVYEGVRP